MSIFKESFKKEVKDQIKERETKIGQGDRTFFLQRQCTIRLASGVNIDNSSNTAISNVLQGGTLTKDLKQRGGFSGGGYDEPIDGYGKVPMPGITTVRIKTKTAYGSLREAIINFECHNLNQLSVLEKLYMRPGYPCLLEWGSIPFINSNKEEGAVGSFIHNLPFISDNKAFFTDAKSLKTDKDRDIQEAIQRIIREKKIEYSHNYDGMYGIIKNFNYSVRPDGGFSCTTELIAIGEVIDSLIGSDGEENSSIPFIEEFLEDLNEYSFSLSEVATEGGDDYDTLARGESFFNFGSSFNNVGSFDQGPIPEEERSPYENEPSVFGTLSIDPDKRLTRRKALEEKLKSFGITLSGRFAGIKSVSVNEFKDIKPLVYIKWSSMIKVLNYYLNDLNLVRFSSLGNDGKELRFNENKIDDDVTLNGRTEADFPIKGIAESELQRIYNLDISINPKICLLPENWKLYYGGNFGDSSVNRNISNIWFEANYLYNTFKSQYYIKEGDDQKINPEFAIGKFIKKIWNDVNDSCAGMHNFEPFSEFENPNIIKIIDLEFQSEIDKNTIHKFNVLNTNSIVRDFNYDITIPNALTSTIAIAAQNAKSPQTLQEVTLRSFNKGLSNRFYHPAINKASKTNDRIYNEKVRAFQKVNELLLYTGESYDSFEDGNIVYRPGFQKYWEYIEALCELQLFIERLKGFISLETDTSLVAKEEAALLVAGIKEGFGALVGGAIASQIPERIGLDPDEVVLNSPSLQSVINYQRKRINDSEKPLEKKYQWRLVGDAYADWDFIPASDISKARNYLRKTITLRRELKNYELQGSSPNQYNFLADFKLDITNIIPLKLNIKLDGISGIVIGNVFNLLDSRLPKTYLDSGVSFIVTGEQQEINGQDWTTSIIGQTVLL